MYLSKNNNWIIRPVMIVTKCVLKIIRQGNRKKCPTRRMNAAAGPYLNPSVSKRVLETIDRKDIDDVTPLQFRK
jgi:hypothetical protein